MNVSRSSLLPYNAKQMYAVIADVRSYPVFLNWCSDSELVSQVGNEVVAKLLISFGRLKFSFVTKNLMVENESVNISLVDGPFSALSGQWLLEELSESACKVAFDMNFDFDSIIKQKLFGRVFQSVISAQLEAFQQRAEDLYGPSPSLS